MIGSFIWGIVMGAIIGAVVVTCWALAAGTKLNAALPETKEEPKPAPPGPLDITPELAAGAHNVIRQYCLQQDECGQCIFAERACCKSFSPVPSMWAEMEASYAQKL